MHRDRVDYGMQRSEWWDWPPTRGRQKLIGPRKTQQNQQQRDNHATVDNVKEYDEAAPRHYYHRRRYRSRFDVYQPTGWNSPVAKKIIDVYWRTTITAIKMLIAIPLTIMLVGSVWLVVTLLRML